MTNTPPPPPGSEYAIFWTDVPNFDPTDPTHLEVMMAMSGNHSHLDKLEEVGDRLASAWTAIHLNAALQGKPCSEVPQHDEVEAELDRLDGFMTRARSGVWN